MLQRIIGVTIGAVVTFLLLLLFEGGRIIDDRNTAYLVACAIGAVASFFWPIVIGWWMVRRTRARRQNAIEAEVERQISEQTRGR